MGILPARWGLVGAALACSLITPPGAVDSAAGGQGWRPPVAKFNDNGLVSPFVELFRSPPTRQPAAKASRDAEATPTSEWSQTDDSVIVTIWVPQLDRSTARVLLSITTLSFTGTSKTGQRYKLDFEQLGGDILPGQAAWETMDDSVYVTLPKRSKGVTWASLGANGRGDARQHVKKSSPKTQRPRRQVEVNTTHKYDVLEAEASDAELGEGRLIARNDEVGSVMTRLFSECSIRSTGWWTFKVCHGRSVNQFHQTDGGTVESMTVLGSIQLEDGADGLDPNATRKSPGVFMAQYTKKRWRQQTDTKDNSAVSRLHSAEIVYSFIGGDQCEGSASGARSGTVTYICGDAPTSNKVVAVGGYRGAYIARIEERRVCEYDLTIHVPALCEFEPFLRPHETEEADIGQ